MDRAKHQNDTLLCLMFSSTASGSTSSWGSASFSSSMATWSRHVPVSADLCPQASQSPWLPVTPLGRALWRPEGRREGTSQKVAEKGFLVPHGWCRPPVAGSSESYDLKLLGDTIHVRLRASRPLLTCLSVRLGTDPSQGLPCVLSLNSTCIRVREGSLQACRVSAWASPELDPVGDPGRKVTV